MENRIKPTLSKEGCVRDRIHLNEKSEIFETELETAQILNNFFLNIVNNLNNLNLQISKYSDYGPFVDNIYIKL